MVINTSSSRGHCDSNNNNYNKQKENITVFLQSSWFDRTLNQTMEGRISVSILQMTELAFREGKGKLPSPSLNQIPCQIITTMGRIKTTRI